jgi:hypothetical protein
MHLFPETTMERKNLRSPWSSSLIVGLLAGLAGCQKSDKLPSLQVYEVNGKVLLADGKPLTAGWVYFVPKSDLSVTPSAQIAADGTFSLDTGGSGKGAPPGEYKVRIEAPQAKVDPKSKNSLFPFKYTDEDSSGLVVTVLAQPNQLEPFHLK